MILVPRVKLIVDWLFEEIGHGVGRRWVIYIIFADTEIKYN